MQWMVQAGWGGPGGGQAQAGAVLVSKLSDAVALIHKLLWTTHYRDDAMLTWFNLLCIMKG